MGKPTRTARQLQEMLRERIDRYIPDLRGQRTDIEDGGIRWVDPGIDGVCNWTVQRTRSVDFYRRDVAQVIRQMQLEYDLDTDGEADNDPDF